MCIVAVFACSGPEESLKPRVLVSSNINPPVRWWFRAGWFWPGHGHGHVEFRAGIPGSVFWPSGGWGLGVKPPRAQSWPVLLSSGLLAWTWNFVFHSLTLENGRLLNEPSNWAQREVGVGREETVLPVGGGCAVALAFFREKEDEVAVIYQTKGSAPYEVHSSRS